MHKKWDSLNYKLTALHRLYANLFLFVYLKESIFIPGYMFKSLHLETDFDCKSNCLSAYQ